MAHDKTGYSDTKYPVQYMENNSYDQTLKVLTREMLTVNLVNGQLERVMGIQGNASYVLSYDGSGNITQIEKTIGGTTYTKTFTYTGDNLTGISVWS
jgi:hypothetical protein